MTYECKKDTVTLIHVAPIYIEDELCGVVSYEVDLTGLVSSKTAIEIGRRIKHAQDRAIAKASTEGADILRRLDKPCQT
jgi:hypothetical protein